MKKPQISVVIPYYNNADTIHRALASVARQSYAPKEVIIVNDASPDADALREIIPDFAGLTIHVLHHKTNRNGSAARNTGISAAKGDWIALLDADDEWEKEHLQKYVAMDLDENVLYFCRAKILAPDFSTFSCYMPIETLSIAEYIFVDSGFVQTSSLLLSWHLAQKIKFNESLARHQDYDFLFRLEAAGVRFHMSDHIGVIVHWEDNTLAAKEKKGGTAEYSLNWARENRQYFTDRAYAWFLFMNVLVPMLRNGRRREALELMRTENLLPSLTPGNLYRILSLFLFRQILKPW